MTTSRTQIIAEVAQGYEGKPEFCELYVRAAAKAGADAVKFQIVYADDVAEPGYRFYDWYKKLEMPLDTWRNVRKQARDLGIDFFCDVSGDRALDMAAELEPDGIKLHASNFFNRALIRSAFDHAERVFISIGGIFEQEVDALVRELEDWKVMDRTVLLYGFQAEPTPVDKSALNRLPLLKARYSDIAIGYLDHTDGDGPDRLTVSAMAMALGADWIEKHLTLSRYLEIEDYPSALEPDEFADYVEAMKRLGEAFGVATMELSEQERAYRDKAVKKLLAARDLAVGDELALQDINLRRTARIEEFSGFHDPSDVVGRKVKMALAAGSPILGEHLE